MHLVGFITRIVRELLQFFPQKTIFLNPEVFPQNHPNTYEQLSHMQAIKFAEILP